MSSKIIRLMTLVVLCCATAASAQVLQPLDTDRAKPTDNGSEPVKKQLESIYALTKTAKSGKDFGVIADRCDEAIKRTDLTEKNTLDLNALKSWALNRRGNKRMELYPSFQKAGNLEQAKMVFASAMEDFDAAIAAAPDRWQTFHSRGIAMVAKEDYAKAAEDFSKVIELNPKKIQAFFNRAEVYYQLGKHKDAVADYEVCLKSSPEDIQALTGRAHANYELSEYGAALKDYEAVIELVPQSPVAFINRAEAHQMSGDWSKAYDDFVASVKIVPTAMGYQKAAWMLATCPDQEFFRPESAIDMAKKAIDLGGDPVTCLETLAAAEAASGDFEAAKIAQARAIKATKKAAESDLESAAQSRMAMYEEGKAVPSSQNTKIRKP